MFKTSYCTGKALLLKEVDIFNIILGLTTLCLKQHLFSKNLYFLYEVTYVVDGGIRVARGEMSQKREPIVKRPKSC